MNEQVTLSKEDYEVEIIIRGPRGKMVCKKITVYSWNNVPCDMFLSEFKNSITRLGQKAIEKLMIPWETKDDGPKDQS